MDYKLTEDAFPHQITLYLKPDREKELASFLTTYCGPQNTSWKTAKEEDGKHVLSRRWMQPRFTLVNFAVKKHAAILKLQWEEDIPVDPWEEFKKYSSAFFSSTGGIGSSYQSLGRAARNMSWRMPVNTPMLKPQPYAHGIEPTWIVFDEESNVSPIQIKTLKSRMAGKSKSKFIVDFESTRVTGTQISGGLASLSIPEPKLVRSDEQGESAADRTSE